MSSFIFPELFIRWLHELPRPHLLKSTNRLCLSQIPFKSRCYLDKAFRTPQHDDTLRKDSTEIERARTPIKQPNITSSLEKQNLQTLIKQYITRSQKNKLRKLITLNRETPLKTQVDHRKDLAIRVKNLKTIIGGDKNNHTSIRRSRVEQKMRTLKFYVHYKLLGKHITQSVNRRKKYTEPLVLPKLAISTKPKEEPLYTEQATDDILPTGIQRIDIRVKRKII